jgi:GNAT superfamily N-acetyltransferase
VVEVRPFARRDREQLSRLVNAHVAAATPGGTIPAAMLLNDLERPLGEDIIGPWVTDFATLVALHHDRLVGAAHLRRYTDDDRASESYRDAGEIVWLVCWPDHLEAGRAVRDRSIARLGEWGARIYYGDGTFPAPGVYGVPDSWPHVRTLYEEAGFDPSDGQVEIIVAGKVDQLPAPGDPPIDGLTVRRQLGPLGTAFNAVLDSEIVGTYEVDDDLTRGGANLAFAGWADECNHWVRDDLRGRGIGTWLVANAGAWLRLGGTSHLMAYIIHSDHTQAWIRYYSRYGLTPINRTTRGWQRGP